MDFSIRGVNVNWEDMRPDNERVSPSQKFEFAQRCVGEHVRQILFNFFHYNWQQVPLAAKKLAGFCEYMDRLAEFEGKRFGFINEDLVSTSRAMRDCAADFMPAQKGKLKEAEYVFGSDWAFLFTQGSMLDTRKRVGMFIAPKVCARYQSRLVQLSETPSYVLAGQQPRTDVILTDFPRTQHGRNYLVACGRVACQEDPLGLKLQGDFIASRVLPFMDCNTVKDKMFYEYRKAVA